MQSDGKLLEELYKWIDKLPLTRPKKKESKEIFLNISFENQRKIS